MLSLNSASIGLSRRMNRIFDAELGRARVVPVDDSLIFGPFDGLRDLDRTLVEVGDAGPSAVLAFPGAIRRMRALNQDLEIILNLTASTVNSHHTRKRWVSSLSTAVAMDASAVAVHVNFTDEFEGEMLETLGEVITNAQEFGMPVVAIAYPRQSREGVDYNYEDLRTADPQQYADLISHCCRIASEMGVDIIKTYFVPELEGMRRATHAAGSIPVLVAGGPLSPPEEAISNASLAVEAGCAGISFGRNVFNQANPRRMIEALRLLLFGGMSVQECIDQYRRN